MSDEPGVVSATIELDLQEPGSPGGLLSLAVSFDRVGYTNLARYLRSCADAMRARPAAAAPSATERIADLRASVPLVLLPVLAEIERATRKFPTWPTDPLHALGVVGEEFGELGKAVLQAVYEPHKSGRDQVRDEAIQTAAMAIRFIASLDAYDYGGSAQHQQSDIANGRLAVESFAGPAGC